MTQQLYYSAGSKTIFTTDDPSTNAADVRAITSDEVADLIANGATMDSSVAGNEPAVAATPVVASTGEATNNPTTTETVVPTTNTPISEVPSAGNDAPAVLVPVASATTSDTADVLTGTTVEVTQVGDSTVNTAIQQSGNVLAGTTGNQLVNSGVTVDAPALGEVAIVTNTEADLNPLVPAAGTEGPPASQLVAAAAEPEAEPMPRESHLMLLEAKFSSIITRLRNQERIAVDELEAIYAHVKAVV